MKVHELRLKCLCVSELDNMSMQFMLLVLDLYEAHSNYVCPFCTVHERYVHCIN